MKNGVYTEYEVNEEKYASYIIGEDFNDIEIKRISRGLNEKVISVIQPIYTIEKYSTFSENEFNNNILNALHASVFAGFVALSSKTMTPHEILGDHGVVHEIIHLMEGSNVRTKNVQHLLSKLENKAIGLF